MKIIFFKDFLYRKTVLHIENKINHTHTYGILDKHTTALITFINRYFFIPKYAGTFNTVIKNIYEKIKCLS